MLGDNGVATVDTATTVAEALSIIAKARPDAAVLDYSLGSGTSLPVAELLLRESIPFIFATGYGDNSMIPAAFSHVRVIGKPYDANALSTSLCAAIADAALPSGCLSADRGSAQDDQRLKP